jgi:hypothetical protein
MLTAKQKQEAIDAKLEESNQKAKEALFTEEQREDFAKAKEALFTEEQREDFAKWKAEKIEADYIDLLLFGGSDPSAVIKISYKRKSDDEDVWIESFLELESDQFIWKTICKTLSEVIAHRKGTDELRKDGENNIEGIKEALQSPEKLRGIFTITRI